MSRVSIWIPCLAWLTVLAIAGCNNRTENNKKNNSEAQTDPHAGHDHASLGPHHGYLIELGEEDYHAEWRFNNSSGKVVIYLLDASARKDVATTAEKIAVTVTREDDTTNYELTAVNRSDTDPPTTSQFELVDTIMLELLKGVGHGIEATLKVTIDDQEYTGSFEHLPH